MKFIIEWLESKSSDWKVATLTNEAGIKYENVSINRTKKSTGEVFPDFDKLMTGSTVYGEYWETPDKQKSYLYPPKPERTQGGANRAFGGGVKAMMKEKQEGIKESQDRKESSIKESSSMRDAVQLAITEFNAYQGETQLQPTLDFLIKKWRKFLLDNWSLPF